jgi:tRNA pseudouridine38-40 synthase
VVEYDGTEFAGWQSQRRGPRTVEAVLAAALERLVRHPVVLYGAGRTDRGVHALGQTASFRTSTGIADARVFHGVNSYLPRDLRVRSVDTVPEGFHARHSALGKLYRYTFDRSPIRGAFSHRWACRVAQPLDLEAMRQAARFLIGEHDFASFATRSKGASATTVRTLHAIRIREGGAFVWIDVVGRSFLYNMVRTIAGTLAEVGRGRRRAPWVLDVLQGRDRRLAGPTAEPQGLCLIEVYYDKERLVAAAAPLGPEEPSVVDWQALLGPVAPAPKEPQRGS